MSKAAERIAAEIREKGAITFARFMELALYCPNCGYYEREEDRIGTEGDYYTSVSGTSLFGELLGFQFAEWLQEGQLAIVRRDAPEAGPEATQVVEAGAHDGRLASDILAWTRRHRPTLFKRLRYSILEPSDTRRRWQQRRLAEFGDKVRWATDFAELAGGARWSGCSPNSAPVQGVVFCNELLDAMPVHRLGWDANRRAWFEWGVTLQAGTFVWTRLAAEKPGDQASCGSQELAVGRFRAPIEEELLELLPDGFSTEFCPAAEQWWRDAAGILKHGKLVAIDYGLTANEFLLPERKEGTLRAYRGHRPSNDVLANPGQQDITAHVNFTAVRDAGEAAGLKTQAFLTQAQFLTSIVARSWEAAGSSGAWTPNRTRQFHTLTHPEHLGRSFRVLVQSRD
jgi:SAM-dependent MidA family methyltransferase